MTAGADALWDEVGFLAFHLNWSLDELVDLPHALRQRLVEQSSGFSPVSRQRSVLAIESRPV